MKFQESGADTCSKQRISLKCCSVALSLMSIMATIQNFRTNRRIEQEKSNAGQTIQRVKNTGLPFAIVPFALAFVFMLTVLVVPASAEINLSGISEVIDAFVLVIDDIMELVLAIIPIWFVMQILAFIFGLLTAILAMINFKHN